MDALKSMGIANETNPNSSGKRNRSSSSSSSNRLGPSPHAVRCKAKTRVRPLVYVSRELFGKAANGLEIELVPASPAEHTSAPSGRKENSH